jgi:hypothetical protein
MDLPFSEEEVLAMIKSAPKEKAPGPDGIIGFSSLPVGMWSRGTLSGPSNSFI